MALEKSVLTQADIRRLLREQYHLDAGEICPLPLGTANCFAIQAGEKRYFLKEFQTGFAPTDIAIEATLVDFLETQNIPVAPFVYTCTGLPYVRYKEKCISLTAFADGISYGYDNLPDTCLPALARMLGRLHVTLTGYPLRESMDESWVSSYAPDKLATQYSALLIMAEGRTADPHREQLVADLTYKRELSYRIAAYLPYLEGLTRCASHGDYQSCQCLWQGDEIGAVIDFSAAGVLPVGWEVMRSFVQSSRPCRQSAVLDVDALLTYVQTYRTVAPLTAQDLVGMPYLYLFQLARSRYGYRQYLEEDSPDRDRLLAFALWRTEMCRQVEGKMEEIVERLLVI